MGVVWRSSAICWRHAASRQLEIIVVQNPASRQAVKLTKDDGTPERSCHSCCGNDKGDEPFGSSSIVFGLLDLGDNGEATEKTSSLGMWHLHRCWVWYFSLCCFNVVHSMLSRLVANLNGWSCN